MKSDADIKLDVEAELNWDPQVDDTDVAVKVTAGAVTLSGYARNYFQRHQAEQTAKRVGGVVAVANDIQVRLNPGAKAADPQIARDAVAALKTGLPLTLESVQVLVDNGHVRLEGKVEWHFLRQRAEELVRHVHGVLTLRNHIAVVPTVTAAEIRQKIEQAFRRSASVDAAHITVDTKGSEVTLWGEVRSWNERDQAQQSAWAAPGVTNVTNNLRVSP
jgi:osmotically-inducible protein OsmY